MKLKFKILYIFVFVLFSSLKAMGFDEEYYKLEYSQMKEEFFNQISSMLDVSFEKLNEEREFAKAFIEKSFLSSFQNLDKKELERLSQIQTKYRIKNLFDFNEYYLKIQPIPKSMAIAQALVESGTGTSRFTKEANNLFGEWTFGAKGLVPNERLPGKTHKIRIFDSLQDSVDSFVLNINRHRAYRYFRDKRLEAIKENKLMGIHAVDDLKAYSENGEYYTNTVKSVIKKYDLLRFDEIIKE